MLTATLPLPLSVTVIPPTNSMFLVPSYSSFPLLTTILLFAKDSSKKPIESPVSKLVVVVSVLEAPSG